MNDRIIKTYTTISKDQILALFLLNVFGLALIAEAVGVTIITLGGLYLMNASIWMYFGKVFYSSIFYIIADICWSINAYNNGDVFGSITVNTGLLLGILVTWKMKRGIFVKDLKKEK